jgi:hypothetical protein
LEFGKVVGDEVGVFGGFVEEEFELVCLCHETIKIE